MLKKIVAVVFAVAFVAGFFANFNSIAEAASCRWRCVMCWKLAISQYKPVDNTICKETGKPHRYIPYDE